MFDTKEKSSPIHHVCTRMCVNKFSPEALQFKADEDHPPQLIRRGFRQCGQEDQYGWLSPSAPWSWASWLSLASAVWFPSLTIAWRSPLASPECWQTVQIIVTTFYKSGIYFRPKRRKVSLYRGLSRGTSRGKGWLSWVWVGSITFFWIYNFRQQWRFFQTVPPWEWRFFLTVNGIVPRERSGKTVP